MELLACGGVFAAICLIAWGSLYWVLGPLDRAAKKRRSPVQFSLADLLCLFVLVQLPLGGITWAARETEDKTGVLVGGFLVGGGVALVWWMSLNTLSRAGIHVVWHRCLALAVILPATYAGTLALILFPFAAVDLLLQHKFFVGYSLLVGEPVIGGMIYVFGRFTRAIVRAAEESRSDAVQADASVDGQEGLP